MNDLWMTVGLYAFVAGGSAFFGAVFGVASCLAWLLYEDAKMERNNRTIRKVTKRMTLHEPADAYRSRQHADYNRWGK